MMCRAFSLKEVLIVIAILGILAAILVPTFASARRSALKTRVTSNLATIGKARAVYMIDGVFVARIAPLGR